MSIYDYRNDRYELLRELVKLKNEIDVPDSIRDADLKDAYTTARALDSYLIHYFNDASRIMPALDQIKAGIDTIFEDCYMELIGTLREVKNNFRATRGRLDHEYVNLFEAAGSEILFLSNHYTRVITENLGHRFERIASLSTHTFNHEDQLGIKIRGIDIIIYDCGRIRYTQMKTKRDTLTGSQVPRSNQELSIHEHSIFAAALDLGKGWTFNNRADNLYPVTRLAGANFWGLTGLDYGYILGKSKELLLRMEEILYKI